MRRKYAYKPLDIRELMLFDYTYGVSIYPNFNDFILLTPLQEVNPQHLTSLEHWQHVR